MSIRKPFKTTKLKTGNNVLQDIAINTLSHNLMYLIQIKSRKEKGHKKIEGCEKRGRSLLSRERKDPVGRR